MKNTLEQLKAQLPNTTGEERLDLLTEIFTLMSKLYDPGVEVYFNKALILAEKLGNKEKQLLIHDMQGWYYLVALKYDLSRDSYKKALDVSQGMEDKTGYANALRHMGNTYKGSGDPEKELFWYEKSLSESQSAGLIREEAWAHNVMGICYGQQMLQDKAIKHCVRALELAKELGEEKLLGASYYNLALFVEDEQSIEYLEKALEFFVKCDSKHAMRSTYGSLAMKYMAVENFKKSIYCANASIEFAKKMQVAHHLLIAYCQKGEILIKQATTQYEDNNEEVLLEALTTCEKGLKVASNVDVNIYYHSLCLFVGEINYYLGFYDKALKELTDVWALIENHTTTDFEVHKNCTNFLWKTYEALGNTEKELHFYKEFVKWDNKAKHSESIKEAKILEAKYLNKEKEIELKRLQEVEEMKTRFFSQITHELRTPLSLILGPASQIPHTPDRKKVDQQAQIIERNANRLLQLVNQLLDVNKLEAGKMELKKSHGEFPVFVETIVKAFQIIANEKQIQLEFINDVDDLIANFDTDKLEKILYNLLSNAFKFTPAAGQIIFQLTQLPSNLTGYATIKISLKDTGRGIAEKDLPHIFNRFYQADNSYTREAEGTGIGLSLVKELVELMDGNITVNSELEKGTHFIIELPLELGDEELVQGTINQLSLSLPELPYKLEDTKVGEKRTLHKETPVLLLIEDNLDMHQYIKSILEDTYIILEAFDGQQGVEIAMDRIPDLIISDVMMPKKDGYEVCAELKEDQLTSHIPIVLLTAKAALKSRIEGLEHGADAYLTKPFSAKELQLQLKNLLTTQTNLQQKYSQLDTQHIQDKNLNKEELFLKKVRAIVEENIDDESLTVEKLSQLMSVSSSQLYRKIHALTNYSTSHFIRDIRLIKGKNLLENKAGNVSQIAYQVGFNPDYFTKCFVKKYGFAPKALLT